MPEEFNYDVTIIGGGPAGYAAGLYGGSAGLKIALIEKEKVGGTCLHRGCVPAKEFLYFAELFEQINKASKFGIKASIDNFDFSVNQDRKNKVVDQLFKGLSSLLKKRGVDIIKGFGKLVAPNTVEVAGDSESQRITSKAVIIASGSVPKELKGFSFDSKDILSSDDVLSLNVLPDSIAIVGGGAIGCEFASFFKDVGKEVVLIEMTERLVPGLDKELAQYLTRAFKKKSIEVKTSCVVESVRKLDNDLELKLSDGSIYQVQKLLIAVGRAPNIKGVISEGLNIEITPNQFVKVNEYLETNIDSVYAIGDIIPSPQLAHVGFAEGINVVKRIMGEPVNPIDYTRVPWCIYTNPEVAFCGFSEEELQSRGINYMVKKDPFGGNSRALIMGNADGLVKVIAKKADNSKALELLGVHMVGPLVTELLYPGYLATNWEAYPEEIASFLAPHPTLSEVFTETVLGLTGRSLHV